jgi:hypothetical protein
MKKILSLLLLATITATAYADKNAKANKVKPSKDAPQPAPAVDTSWQGTGNKHYEFGTRSYDARTARYGYVDIDSATAVKYGCTRPTMPAKSSNPYQGTTNNPVKLMDK